MSKKKAKVAKSFADFLGFMGADCLYQAGRSLYRGVACGPWISAIVEVRGDKKRHALFSIGMVNNHVMVTRKIEKPDPDDTPSSIDLIRAGFTPEGVLRTRNGVRSLVGYKRMVDEFNAKSRSGALEWNIRCFPEDPYSGIPDRRHLWVRIEETLPPVLAYPYYEDSIDPETLGKVIGIRVGSIVEGSDMEVGPEDFMMDTFWEGVALINKEAVFYWGFTIRLRPSWKPSKGS